MSTADRVDERAGPAAQQALTSFQSGWALALLTLVFCFNQVDRGIVAIVLDSIKAEMKLSDTTLGLMTGLGFAFVYFCAAFPLGRLADRTDRIKIISVGVMFYSVMAMFMGLAQNVFHLITFRSLVAVGEASGNAPSSAVIADLYPHEKRPRATAIWSGGSYLGLFVGLTAGGWIHEHYGWRAALWGTAGPGMLVGLLLMLTVRDPPRGASEALPQKQAATDLKATLNFLRSQRSYVLVVFAMLLSSFTAFSVQTWVPSFLVRVHHMDKGEIGFYAGLFKGLMGLLGVLAGGFLTQQIIKTRPHLIALVPIVASLLIPFAVAVFILAEEVNHTLVALAVAGFLIPAYQGAGMTMLVSVVPPAMRSFAITIMFAALALGGLGLGPLVVGMLSDYFTATAGADSLRYALVFPGVLPFVTAFLFFCAARGLTGDQERISQN